MVTDMSVTWRDEAFHAFEFLRTAEGFEEVFADALQQYERLKADPGGHRTGVRQRQVGGVMVWMVELGPEHERWIMVWTSPAPGAVRIEGIERL